MYVKGKSGAANRRQTLAWGRIWHFWNEYRNNRWQLKLRLEPVPRAVRGDGSIIGYFHQNIASSHCVFFLEMNDLIVYLYSTRTLYVTYQFDVVEPQDMGDQIQGS